jgi:hypothetical protein
MTIATGDDASAADVLAIQATATSALTAAGVASASAATALANSEEAQAAATAAGELAAVALSVAAPGVVNSISPTDTIQIGHNGSTVAVTAQTFNAGLTAEVAAVSAVASAAGTALSEAVTIDLLPTATTVSDTDTFTVGPGGVCEIDRSITTYQQNASGQPDNSYLNTNIMFQAMYAARYISAQMTSQYIVPGKILVANGTLIPPGSIATTPNMMLATAVAVYAYLASQFIVQNVQTFAQNAYATTGTKGQVLMYLPIDFSDQVINVDFLVQFQQST